MSDKPSEVRQSPHTTDSADVALVFDVDPTKGLNSSTVDARRITYGQNEIQSVKPRPAWRILIDQFASIVVALLGAAAAVSWVTGEAVETIAILVVLLINALVGFITEWRASQALNALRRQTRTTTRVRRDGLETTIYAEELVPGDIIVLNAGDRVPADARLLEALHLETEESALTGESATVEKSVVAVDARTPLAERR